MKHALALLVLTVSLLAGCPSGGQTADDSIPQITASQLDGQWRVRDDAGALIACIELASGDILSFDPGCSGAPLSITYQQPVATVDNVALFRITVDYGDYEQTHSYVLEMTSSTELVGVDTHWRAVDDPLEQISVVLTRS